MPPVATGRASDGERGALWGWLCAIGLVLLVFVCFSPALSAGFVAWDDNATLLDHDHWRGFTPDNLRWMFTAFHNGHYHPLTWVSFGLDYLVWGMRPVGYHLTNIAIHAVNAVLFFLLVRRLIVVGLSWRERASGETDAAVTVCAALAGAVFAIHPLRAESVAWVTERRDVLSAMFLLLASLAYVRSVAVGEARVRSWGWFAASLVLMGASCLSKAWGMTFFVPLLALDVFPLRRLPMSAWRWASAGGLRVLAEKIPMAAIGVATAVLAAKAQHSGLAAKTLAEWGAKERAVQSVYGLWFYVRETVAPGELSALYELPTRVDPWEGRFVAAYIMVAVLAGVAWWTRGRWPAVLVAAAVYGVTLAPVLGILQSGEQFVADRYSYLATMPLATVAGAGVLLLVGRLKGNAARGETGKGPALLGAACGIVVLTLGALTFAQTGVWHNTETLWAHAASVTRTTDVLTYYATEIDRQGRHEQAAELFQEAVTRGPGNGRAWFSLGNLLLDAGNNRDGERALIEAARTMPRAFQAHQNLGILYMNEGRTEEGMRQFELAVADVEKAGAMSRTGGPYMVLGLAQRQAGRTAEAEANFRKAAEFADTRVDALTQLKGLGK